MRAQELVTMATPADANENTGPTQITTTTILLVLSTIFVILRFWARHFVTAQYGTDDWLIVAGLVSVFVIGGLNYGMVDSGMGRHASTLNLDAIENVLKLLLGFECMYVTAVALIKFSLLAMYLRIFPSRGFKIAAYIIGGTVAGWWIAIVLVCIFQCNPIYVAWEPWVAGQCIDLKGSFIGNAVPNIVTDIAILIMPVKQVWALHTQLAQKISLICTFGLGSFVLIASIYRFSTIMQFDPNDTTFTLATACTWCVVECACGVICACLPTLRPLARKVSSQFGSTGNKSRSGSRANELVTIGGGNTSHMNSRNMTKSPFQKLGKDSEFMYPGEADLSTRPGSGGVVRTTEVTMTSSSTGTTKTTQHGYASSGDSGTILDRSRSRGETGSSFV
ncbi:hypothetical protein KVR01_006466 [Diaporthe batatas]|uniref:uncharacterized protein n=1 Tax=Diaporthe batatas TaxID=748121 RepID=UPI001D040D24|nr:uncharacterized protein KVR01_006466 [Diaporthe batatas]KAG8164548.1 hypothetical protein KVR01_006466 [Diaporthe batatas]